MSSNLPRIILYLALVLVVAGIVLHGIAWAEFQRIWDHLIARPGGSLALRFFLQPAMASIFAVRDGIKDAHTGRSPYFWTVFTNPEKRRDRLREGLDATGKIILIAIALDAIYQYITHKTFYPVEALIVAVLLAFIPYLLIRGPVARIARRWMARHSAGSVS
jgi:hypothetical protein